EGVRSAVGHRPRDGHRRVRREHGGRLLCGVRRPDRRRLPPGRRRLPRLRTAGPGHGRL
ncbi:MAG: hypothetical protein AVDCRST_MAG20-2627, partial [uncultured Acidimicrobiales bacterium]